MDARAMNEENDWKFYAECNDKWGLFDSVEDEYGEEHYPHFDEAVALCRKCPVYSECRLAGDKEITGIWAGQIKTRKRR
jgi:hypothetical protein